MSIEPSAFHVYFDFETTGFLPRGKIVQFGAVSQNGHSFDQLVNPGEAIPERSSRVHRIYDEDVMHAPSFKEAWRRFLVFLDDVAPQQNILLVGWNSWSFDDKMLNNELLRCGLSVAAIEDRKIWTADGLRALRAAMRCKAYASSSTKLEAVYSDIKGHALENAHNALSDCLALQAVMPRFLPYLEYSPFAEIGLKVDLRTIQCLPQPEVNGVETLTSTAPEEYTVVELMEPDATTLTADLQATPDTSVRLSSNYTCNCGRTSSGFFECSCSKRVRVN